MRFSYIKASNLLMISNFARIGAVLAVLLTSSSIAYSQTPELNSTSNGKDEVVKESDKISDEREQKQLELLAKGDIDFSSMKGSNFAYLKETNFGVINKLFNPRFASTLKKENLASIVSAMPILVDEDLNLLYGQSEYQTLYEMHFSSTRKTNSYIDHLGQYIYIPEIKGGVFSILNGQIISTKISENTSVLYMEAQGSFISWINLQIEIGNYCIIDKSGIPSIKNLPELSEEDLSKKEITDMREKAYTSLVKRWYYYYSLYAKKSLQQCLPGWDKLANAHEVYTAFCNLQTIKTKK